MITTDAPKKSPVRDVIALFGIILSYTTITKKPTARAKIFTKKVATPAWKYDPLFSNAYFQNQ